MEPENLSTGLFLDSTYTRALLLAAEESGHAGFVDGAGIDGFESLVLDTKFDRKFRTTALEMSVLFDKVHLLGAPKSYDFLKLCDDGVVDMALTVGAAPDIDGFANLTPQFVKEAKPLLFEYIYQRQNAMLKEFGRMPLSPRVASRAYDSLAYAADANIDFTLLRDGPLAEILRDSSALFNADNAYQDLVREMFGQVFVEMSGGVKESSKVYLALVSISAALGTLFELWSNLGYARGFDLPILSRFMVGDPNRAFHKDNTISDTFRLCQIVMHDKLKYAPVVSSYEDVLRLRDHKSIVRFRELLQTWCRVIQSGEVAAIREITRDIELANADLKKLDKWKRVDHWLFWLQLPTSFVPGISQLMTIYSTVTRVWFNERERRNSWVSIGR